eukprot:TRINITY_DN4572_c0_g1::TRINITY_DN4572_c0_g1_i1::g.23213::m.23213 TRINITY_DN4572_c0_g1::TRINITY_DN4572_c0_g1_i1::g.23213  ORF type:complete len:360 (-),score=73.54,sp/A2RVM0/TIC32_ARATH/46.30/7e-81,adh_short/PF00106.20/1.9e-19,KR/PF08659.5/1.6e-07,adh_short_C2/PF13561.1/0.00021,Epimerase/PF01370.16/0.0016 TRINITY_DN4572_c0_g1_i1:124-1155(-)
MGLLSVPVQWFKYLLALPTEYGYSSGSTAEDIAQNFISNIRGKVAIVTGANSGIGLETSRVLAKMGCTVVLACRSMERGEEAVKEIRMRNPNAEMTMHVLELDLGSFDSVRAFAKKFLAMGLPLHFLVNNAGIMACPLAYTKDGHESQFGTNHLGHFLLTNLLLPKLKESAPSRIIMLSSTAHVMAYPMGGIRFDDLKGEKMYLPWLAYGQSKLANLIHARALNKLLSHENSGVTAVSVHPGAIQTNLVRYLSPAERMGMKLVSALLKSVEAGAATSMFCICHPAVTSHGGEYFADCAPTPPDRPAATDDETAARLWEVSERLTDSTYPAPGYTSFRQFLAQN